MIQLPSTKSSLKKCPVCLTTEDVRRSGKKANITQYYCSFCKTYFIPSTVYNTHKKIWHDKIFWKRIRLFIDHLNGQIDYEPNNNNSK